MRHKPGAKAVQAIAAALRYWSGESGWGYARLTFAAVSAKIGDEVRVVLSDLRAPVEVEEYYKTGPKRPRVTWPDPRPPASMDAQIAHLMMSLVQVSDAHQALRQGRPEAVWTALHQLWNRQASPGLYTWDAPRPTTDDVAHGWQYARGWHNETAVTPDYETAALLLIKTLVHPRRRIRRLTIRLR